MRFLPCCDDLCVVVAPINAQEGYADPVLSNRAAHTSSAAEAG